MENEKEVIRQIMQEESSENAQPGKKTYRAPELVEWGSLQDLTKGGGGTDADPYKGSSTFF